MSNQNRFLLPHQPTSIGSTNQSTSNSGAKADNSVSNTNNQENEPQLSVDDNFDSYWEEEARNPHRNRIRIGRQYQATVPQLLKPGERDQRKLEELETLSFCPKRSAKVSNAELDHYFTVAKSLNLFASLVETRSLLGRDVTIADLNRIRHKEGLSLASVIQPNRHTSSSNSNISPQSSQQTNSASQASSGEQKSPTSATDNLGSSSNQTDIANTQDSTIQETYTPNLALMRALSHFISLHHPCHHDNDCKKMLKDSPLEEEQEAVVSIKSGNLRGQSSLSSQSPSKETKSSRSRSSTKQQSAAISKSDESEAKDAVSSEQEQASSDTNQPAPYYDWTREEVNLFSKAIEVCGKNFGSIKKEFLPSKSVRSIVEYYYIGSREASDSKKRSNHGVDSTDGCSSIEKSQANNNGGGGGNGSGGDHTSPNGKNASGSSSSENNNTSGPTSHSDSGSNNGNKSIPDAAGDADKQAHTASRNISNKINISSRQSKIEDPSNNKPKAKNIDARMSVYNFDDEIKEENSPLNDCPCPGAEVKPLKAKPILPNAPAGSEAGNSNVGSLKFFMDGQLVLKLNACQEQQKCHWVQSGDKIPTPNQRQKRYSKRTSDRLPDPTSQNGSHSNSINDDDLKTEELTADDEDSKESANSFTNIATPRQNSFSASPSPKRSRVKTEANLPPSNQAQMPSPIDYNRLAVTNMKERNDNNLNNNNILNNPIMNPWLQANNFAMAAGLFSLFPQAATNLVSGGGGQLQSPVPNIPNMAPRPMDLSVEHSHSQKPMQATPKSASRSKSKQKHN